MPADQKLHLTTTHAWWKSLSHYNLNWQFVYFFKKLYSKLYLNQCEKGKVNVTVHTFAEFPSSNRESSKR